MAPGAKLIALEIDRGLADLLRDRYDDPRLQVVCDSAENLDEHLAEERADVLVCALPFTSLEPGLRRRILESLPRALAPGGVALVIQYSPLIQSELRRLFPSVRRRISPLNVPPAFLFACSTEPEGGPPAA
jgi:phospholipid N-methyltransferase